MEQEKREAIVSNAKNLWDGDEKGKSIDILYEAIPLDLRPKWLTEILLSVQMLIPDLATLDEIIKLSEQDIDWNEISPHEILYAIEEAGGTQDSGSVYHIHLLAYYVGKQIVNVKGYQAPFDHINLFLVPHEMEQIAKLIDDDGTLLQSMWEILSNLEFIQLEEPIMCNPNCVLCIMRSGKQPFS